MFGACVSFVYYLLFTVTVKIFFFSNFLIVFVLRSFTVIIRSIHSKHFPKYIYNTRTKFLFEYNIKLCSVHICIFASNYLVNIGVRIFVQSRYITTTPERTTCSLYNIQENSQNLCLSIEYTSVR